MRGRGGNVVPTRRPWDLWRTLGGRAGVPIWLIIRPKSLCTRVGVILAGILLDLRAVSQGRGSEMAKGAASHNWV